VITVLEKIARSDHQCLAGLKADTKRNWCVTGVGLEQDTVCKHWYIIWMAISTTAISTTLKPYV